LRSLPVNGGVVLGVGDVAVEEGLGGAFIHETARDDDDALVIGDGHGAGLNHGLAGKIALGGHQRPGAVQARWSRAKAENAKRRVVKTAAVMVVEYVLMITFQGLLFLLWSRLRAWSLAAFAHTLLVCFVLRVILFVLLLLLFAVLRKWSRHGRCSPYADTHTHHYRQSPDTVFQIRIHRKFVPSSWKEHAGGRSGGCGLRPGERHGPALVFLYYSSR
jgi:hypothetical protein